MTSKRAPIGYISITSVSCAGWVLMLTLCAWGCQPHDKPAAPSVTKTNTSAVAFLSDVHFHDVFARVPIADLPVLGDSTVVFLRSMESQSLSTRLFNENYFALLAALDDIVRREIRYVVLNGDFSDDGQPVHVDALRKILDHYVSTHGIRFFMGFGNHDPYLPYTNAAGKSNFLFNDGQIRGIYSAGHPECTSGRTACFDALRELGYAELFDALASFGFRAHRSDLIYETPFSYRQPETPIDSDSRQFDLVNRTYTICTDDNSWCVPGFDTSYLVSPEPGIWFLSIDANVHLPKITRSSNDLTEPAHYHSSGNAGFNAVVAKKPYLLEWIADVVRRAESAGAQLFTFSHYPIGNFHIDEEQVIRNLMGSSGMQQNRVPTAETRQAIAATRIPFHVGGHLHLNNTHQVSLSDSTGRLVTGIQSPSLSAYIPGYTIIRYIDAETIHTETVVLEHVSGFDTFFELYWREKEANPTARWSTELLSAPTYLAYTEAHLENLVRERFLPEEWPKPLAQYAHRPIMQLMTDYTGVNAPISCSSAITALTLITDIYRLRSAGSFALRSIPAERLGCYRELETFMAEHPIHQEGTDHETVWDSLTWSVILANRFNERLPDQSFTLHIPTGIITADP